MFLSWVVIFSLLFVFPTHVHAYLDPGNGSYLIQLFFGGFLGIIISFKLFSKKISAFFAEHFRHEKPADQDKE